jgi:hypothetical protein
MSVKGVPVRTCSQVRKRALANYVHAQAVADLELSKAQERLMRASVTKLQDELKEAEDKCTVQQGLLVKAEQVLDNLECNTKRDLEDCAKHYWVLIAVLEQDLLAAQRSLEECQDALSTKVTLLSRGVPASVPFLAIAPLSKTIIIAVRVMCAGASTRCDEG